MRAAVRRYAFTIVGIAIGVAGLVALGAMAERIVRFIEGGDRFVLGQISVAGRGMGIGAGFTGGLRRHWLACARRHYVLLSAFNPVRRGSLSDRRS